MSPSQWRKFDSQHLRLATASTKVRQQAVQNHYANHGTHDAFEPSVRTIEGIADSKLIRRNQ